MNRIKDNDDLHWRVESYKENHRTDPKYTYLFHGIILIARILIYGFSEIKKELEEINRETRMIKGEVVK